MRWYNHEHRQSRIRFGTLVEQHRRQDHQALARRHEGESAGTMVGSNA